MESYVNSSTICCANFSTYLQNLCLPSILFMNNSLSALQLNHYPRAQTGLVLKFIFMQKVYSSCVIYLFKFNNIFCHLKLCSGWRSHNGLKSPTWGIIFFHSHSYRHIKHMLNHENLFRFATAVGLWLFF